MKNVIVVGVGGIGARIVAELPRFVDTIATVMLIDNDTYDATNRRRQPFALPGKAKVVVMKEFLKGRIKNVSAVCSTSGCLQNIEAPKDTFVFCAPDNHACRIQLSAWCVGNKVPCVFLGNDTNEGCVFLYGGKGDSVPFSIAHPEIFRPEIVEVYHCGAQDAYINQMTAAVGLKVFEDFLYEKVVAGEWRIFRAKESIECSVKMI